MTTTSPALDIVPAGSYSDPDLIAVFNRVYSDYFVPVQVNEPAWRALLTRFDIDLEASRLSADRRGVALLGLRGPRGWVGGMGVAPEGRRTGLGRALMLSLLEQARRRAVREVVLEVLEQNLPAIALYEALGFARLRTLDVWSLDAPLEAAGAREIDAGEAQAWIVEHRTRPEPWQREDASVPRFASPEHPLRGLELRERGRRVGAAVALVVAERASLLQLAADGEHPQQTARALCAAARAWAPTVRFLNVPADDPAALALREAGGRLEARQFEMSIALASAS